MSRATDTDLNNCRPYSIRDTYEDGDCVHHPVFEVEAFRSASVDGLWLSAEVDGAEAEAVASDLRGLGARQVSIVGEALR